MLLIRERIFHPCCGHSHLLRSVPVSKGHWWLVPVGYISCGENFMTFICNGLCLSLSLALHFTLLLMLLLPLLCLLILLLFAFTHLISAPSAAHLSPPAPPCLQSPKHTYPNHPIIVLQLPNSDLATSHLPNHTVTLFIRVECCASLIDHAVFFIVGKSGGGRVCCH